MTWIKAARGARGMLPGMSEDDAAAARRKIDYYRRKLAEGVEGDLARLYAAEIVKLDALLDEFERGKKKG